LGSLVFVRGTNHVKISVVRSSLENLLIPSEKACKIHCEDAHAEQKGTPHGNQNRHD
jgi:hypothetical protein